MLLDSILPMQELSATEKDILVNLFREPTVLKYLKIEAMKANMELLTFSTQVSTDSSAAKALAKVQGKLEILATLAAIPLINQTKEQ